jgi:hypothetical protein
LRSPESEELSLYVSSSEDCGAVVDDAKLGAMSSRVKISGLNGLIPAFRQAASIVVSVTDLDEQAPFLPCSL